MQELEGELMPDENKQRIAPKEDFWEGSADNVAVDAIAAAVAKGAEKSDLGEVSDKVEESADAPESTESVSEESKKEETKANLKFKSHEEAESAYRERQSAADKFAAEAEKLRSKIADQAKLQENINKLHKALGDVDNPELRSAIEEVQQAVKTDTLDRTKVDPNTASEIERVLAANRALIAEQQARLDALEANAIADSAATSLEGQYPFASEIKEKAADLLAKHSEGEIPSDTLVAELAKIGFEAGVQKGRSAVIAAERTGSDAGGEPGVASDTGDEKPKSDVDVLTEGILQSLSNQKSYI